MPLALGALTGGLPGAGGADYPATTALCAKAWADAIGAWAAGITPLSTTVAAAQATLEGALLGAFTAPSAAGGMESALAAFAATVGAGMLAAGYIATPPPGLVGFASIFAGPRPSTRQAAVLTVAHAIDTWGRTGMAGMVAPPFTVLAWA